MISKTYFIFQVFTVQVCARDYMLFVPHSLSISKKEEKGLTITNGEPAAGEWP